MSFSQKLNRLASKQILREVKMKWQKYAAPKMHQDEQIQSPKQTRLEVTIFKYNKENKNTFTHLRLKKGKGFK